MADSWLIFQIVIHSIDKGNWIVVSQVRLIKTIVSTRKEKKKKREREVEIEDKNEINEETSR